MRGAGVDQVGEHQEQGVAHRLHWLVRQDREVIPLTRNISRSVKLGFSPISVFFRDRTRIQIIFPGEKHVAVTHSCGGSLYQGLYRLGLEFFSNGPGNIYLHQAK